MPTNLNEAQERTPFFRLRAYKLNCEMGVWRWQGLREYRDIVLAIVQGRRTIDFGGFAGPLGHASIVVDPLDSEHKTLKDVPGKVGAIFSSHTIEHIAPLQATLSEMAEKTEPGGYWVFHLPAYTCERWRAGVHSSEITGTTNGLSV